MKDVLAIILGGGQGVRLFPLTELRSKPAVPLAGKYRLIDLPVSNCINSEITRIYVLTQFNSASLNRHIIKTYNFSRFEEGFVDILAAEQTPENKDWFQGTADAVRQNFRHFEDWNPRLMLILSGDHLYRMDYRDFIKRHIETKADVTISVIPEREENASGFGLLKIDQQGRIIEFREKPKGEALRAMRVDNTRLGLSEQEAQEKPYLASMGIYVFNKKALSQLLFEDTSRVDFGREIIPAAIGKLNVQAFLFDGYWEDIGTIKSFYNANMELTMPVPKFNFFDAEAPIYTHARMLPGSKLRECHIHDSIIAEGSIINEAVIDQCVIGIRSRIEHGARLERSLMMGADFYQSIKEMEEEERQGIPRIGVGRDSFIRKAIIDKNARIGAGVKILNERGIENADGQGYYIRDGIVIVPKGATIPDGTVI